MKSAHYLLFGIGVALHAKILGSPSPCMKPSPIASHESIV